MTLRPRLRLSFDIQTANATSTVDPYHVIERILGIIHLSNRLKTVKVQAKVRASILSKYERRNVLVYMSDGLV